ncbi:MAG: methionine--tRNA ligase [Parcubacteria group bacterium]|nr:methionine--tRNA ligase [Parcubacteria group bacterium]
MKKPNKFYVTTSVPYVNAAPHLGFALELVQADVVARYRRSKGDDVFFSTGADEHGAKIAKTAEAAGLSPRELTDQNAGKFRELAVRLNISNDDFIRTSDEKRHFPAAQKLWRRIAEKGDIFKKEYEGLYCVGCEAFITAKDLTDGKCATHEKEPEKIKEENYFFRLSKHSEEIGRRIKNGELKIIPQTRANEILSLIEGGLEDVSFSRPAKDLPWGVPVPDDESQTMYVWCDALANYLSVLGYAEESEKFKKFWPADIHCIGKDILRFHAAIWPGMLLSAGLPLPRAIFVHGFIGADGRKMSKSLGNVVDPFGLAEKYGVDAVRYYLLREIPAYEDGDFSRAKFENRYNGDLANGLGNFAARVLTLAAKDGKFSEKNADESMKEKISEIQKTVEKKMEEYRFHEALAAVWELISFGDEYVNATKPWETNDQKALVNLLIILESVAALLVPFLPETAQKIISCVGRDGEAFSPKKCGILFPRLVTPPLTAENPKP